MSKPKVMVTGSCGFIGHHLTRELVKRGYWVIGLDNFSTGKQEYARESQEFIKTSVLRVEPFQLKDVDYVFHLAAKARVPYSIEYPEETNNTNVNGTLRMLEASKKAGVKKFIYSSSSAAYGDGHPMPLSEEMTPNPMNPYAVQKLAAEYYCEVYRKIHKLPTVSLRYFNVFGEEQPADNPYTGVITRFLDLKKQGQPLTIYGDGEQKRDFTYVKDVVNVNLLAAESEIEGVFNVGTGTNYSVNEVADAVGGTKTYLPARQGDPRETSADITRAQLAFDYQPTIDVLTWIKNQG